MKVVEASEKNIHGQGVALHRLVSKRWLNS
jgi:hypothetical protein